MTLQTLVDMQAKTFDRKEGPHVIQASSLVLCGYILGRRALIFFFLTPPGECGSSGDCFPLAHNRAKPE